MLRSHWLFVLFVGLVITSPASANSEEVEVQVFEASYFQRFAPQTAIDMLRRVPGFSVRQTGGGRGLGQGGANVLINGERVTSKDAGAIDILEQTPATIVVRIELADAASLGVTGLTGQVANVVINRGSFSGNWEYNPLFRHNARPRLTRGSAAVAGSSGKLDYSVGLDHRSWRGTEEGVEERLLADGELVEERFEDVRSRFEQPTLTVDLGYALNAKTALSLTTLVSVSSSEGREESYGPDDIRLTADGEDSWNASISGELLREMGPGSLRLIGFQSYADIPLVVKTETFSTDGSFSERRFEADETNGESIGRAEYGWSRPGGVTWEAAAEGAFNFLEVDTLSASGEGGPLETTVSPTTRVEELRYQGSITRGFTWWDSLAIQLSLATEWSRLTVNSADGDREETFLRPKGSLSLSYPVSKNFDVRGRVERTVGQLNFGDFVDSVDLLEQREFAGNESLVPQQAWVGEVELEQRFGENEKVIVRVIGELIEDRVDRILIDGGEDVGFIDAVGNIDEARAVRFETEGTVLTDRWGFTGGRFDFTYSRFGSELEDPITDLTRGFNGAHDWSYDLQFRHDIPSTPYAWSVTARHEDDAKVVRFNEVLRRSRATPDYGLSFDHKDFFGMNLRLGARNLANSEFDLERVRYDGLRTTEPIDIVERRVRTENERFFLRLSGTF